MAFKTSMILENNDVVLFLAKIQRLLLILF